MKALALIVLLADVTGLWHAKKSFGPEVHGMLTIEKDGDAWRAEIAGREAAVRVEQDRVTFDLPHEEGTFRGRIQHDRITGHWIQPHTQLTGTRFATPVTLEKQRPNRWRGNVEPMADTLTLFLPVTRKEDGTLATFFRNPERNFGRFQRVDAITVDGPEVKLTGPAAFSTEGQYVDDQLAFPARGGWYDLQRATPAEEARFYPRAKNSRYAYRKPPLEDDGWPVATVEDAGLDRAALAKFLQMILDNPVDTLGSQQVHAVLLARNGRLVLEEYFHGSHREEIHDLRSAAKSVASMLAGAANIPASTKVYAAMQTPTNDARAQSMTLEHLLNMASGLDCDDSDSQSPGAEDNVAEQEDQIAYSLRLNMIRTPGETAVYCSINTNLAGAVVAKQTGRWLPELFHEKLAAPLQFGRYAIPLMPLGEAYMGGSMRLRARDFLKLAQVMLDGGKWRGKQIVSAEWVRASWKPRYELSGIQYGYQWWSMEFPYRDRKVRAYFAGGNGGQVSMGIPELGLAVVFFGGNYADPATFVPQRQYVPQYVLPAVR
jgi:CubicO group peptidase (beta-lactamase class C family)